MYGLGNLGMRPGNAKMMRPHNPLMNPGMTMVGGGKHFADGGSTDDGRPKRYSGTMSKISPEFTIGYVLRQMGLLGPKDAAGAAIAPGTAAAPVATTVPLAAPLAAPDGGDIAPRGYDAGGPVTPDGGGSVSPLMQEMLQAYQRSQAMKPTNPYAPVPAASTAAGAVAPLAAAGTSGPAPKPAPFSLPGAQAAPVSMVPQRPIPGGMMQGHPMASPSPAPSGQPMVPFMSPGISAPGYARGGSPHHVQGPGGGQEDLIDAKLSDGEWVGDATFVSDVGDGSNKEGARRLDKLRDLVAQTKGRQGRYAPETPPLEKLAKKAGIFGSKTPVKKAQGGPLSSVRRDYATVPPNADTGVRDASITGVRG